jgi:hypothetical protein
VRLRLERALFDVLVKRARRHRSAAGPRLGRDAAAPGGACGGRAAGAETVTDGRAVHTEAVTNPQRRRGLRSLVARMGERPPAWAGYAAFAWALLYALCVRLYQGLGGTVGLAGTFEDPERMRKASLLAAGGILLMGIASLALVRPWGVRPPRSLVIGAALAGSAYAAAHALTAYVTKPLHAAGIIELRFVGWATRHEAAQFAWDLLFYEPWFLGLGVFVTLGALHHHRRTGGSVRVAGRLVWTTVAGALLLTAIACAIVVARNV